MAIDALGYLAGLCLIMMACMKTQRAMRLFNIAGNATFILYGALAGIWPVLFLNSVMLAIHAFRVLAPKNTKER